MSADRQPWHDVAGRLWRHDWHTFVEIAHFLALEGWDVAPGEVADAVLGRAAGELAT